MRVTGIESFANIKRSLIGERIGVLLRGTDKDEIAERLANGEKLFLVEKPGITNKKDKL
jgi:translation elongation factor EF-Tu-like GTPase